jgi:hypothetical protein
MSSLAPVDPNLSVPPAVRAAAARSQEAFENAYKNETIEPSEDQTEQTPESGTENSFTASTAEAEPVTREVSEQPKEDRQQGDDQSWEHRYKSMKGRYDRASQQIQTLSEQISSLQNVIATMQVTHARTSEDDFEPSVAKLLTPEEENDYGADFLSVVGKKAREELLPIVNKYEAKIAQLEAKLQGVDGFVAKDARSRLEQTMDAQVPNWRELNFNPEFIQWLKLPDPYSGVIRHDMLKEAYGRNDSARVANFFKGFLAEEAAVDPANTRPDLSTSASNAQVNEKIPLETFAAPGRAKTAAASSAPAEKPVFTRPQIAKFYQDSAAGKYRGKEAERDRIEKQIFDAEREGRIR